MRLFNKLRYSNFLLFLILTLGLFVRVYRIDSLPAGLHRDEASVGYNAYLLFHTLHDEHGKFLPFVFEAFGDWKRPINIYLSALLTPITGMSAITIRLPVALFGWISILLLYLIVERVTRNKNIALLSAFIMAVSPWHIFMSRTGLGWNVVGLTIFLFACYLLLLSRANRWYGFLSGSMFGLNLFAYASNQFITPLFILFLAVWHGFQSKKIKVKKEFALPFVVLFIVFISIYAKVIQENSVGSSFFTKVFSHYSLEIPYSEHQSKPQARLFHNKAIGWSEKFAQNYLQLFSPQFLLYNTQDNPSYSLKNSGNIYLFEIAFLCIGLYVFLRKKFPYYLLLISLIIIIPVPTAFTQNPFSSTRSLMFVPIIAFLTALGMYHVATLLKKTVFRDAFAALLVICYIVSIVKLSEEYLVHFPINRAEHWGDAQKQLVDYLSINSSKYDEILISRPHETFYIYLMYYSFFDTYKPHEIERYPKSIDGFVYAKSLDNYSFREVQYVEDLKIPNRLIVDKTLDMDDYATPSAYLTDITDSRGPLYTEVRVEKTIKLPDGTPVYSVLSTSDLKALRELSINN